MAKKYLLKNSANGLCHDDHEWGVKIPYVGVDKNGKELVVSYSIAFTEGIYKQQIEAGVASF